MNKLFNETIILRFLLVTFSALLVANAMSISGLAWIAFIPYFFVLKNSNSKQTIFWGFVFGTVFSVFTLYGVVLFSFPLGMLIVFYLSIFASIFNLGFSFIERKLNLYWLKVLSIPAFWTSLEYLRSLGVFSFPTSLGLTQSKFISLIQISSITGIYGVSFLIVLVNYSLFNILLYIDERDKKIGFLKIFKTVVFVIILISFFIYAGSKKVVEPENNFSVNVSIIQGSIPTWLYDIEKWEEKYENIVKNTYFQLTEKAVKDKPYLIIWPETAIRRWIMDVPLLRDKLSKLAKEGNCFLIIGTPSLNKEGKEFNSVFIISPRGEVTGQYNKQYLVPFTEACFSPGEGCSVIKAGEAKLGINICFESIYPSISRKFIQNGANLLIICTNDGGFKKTLLVNLHAAYAIFRAVENRTYVIRAAQSGISLIVDPYGDVFSYLCLIISLIALVLYDLPPKKCTIS